VIPCSPINIYIYFGGMYCFHLQGRWFWRQRQHTLWNVSKTLLHYMARYFISHAHRGDLRMLTNTGSYPTNLHLLAQTFPLFLVRLPIPYAMGPAQCPWKYFWHLSRISEYS
jgi:hypothetical protein